MHRVSCLSTSTTNMLSTINCFTSNLPVSLVNLTKIQRSFVTSCAASHISTPVCHARHKRATHSQSHHHYSSYSAVGSRHSRSRGGTVPTAGHLLLSHNVLLGQSNAQARNYSSFTEYLTKMLTVKAVEPTDAEFLPLTTSADKGLNTTPVASDPTPLMTPVEVLDGKATTDAFSSTDAIEYIPLPPVPPELDITTLTSLGEPTMNSLGLGGWGPVSTILRSIELIHTTIGLPWWGSIVIATIIMRTLVFPLMIITQRNSAKLANVGPQMQAIQTKISDAKKSGDQMAAAQMTNEMMLFMKKKGLHPFRTMMVPLAQAPIFMSMFVGLRRCANAPVMSMTTGGMLWFSDLTAADPYYLLPVMTCCTMFLTIHLGTETGRTQMTGEHTHLILKVMKAIPFITFPFMVHFPTTVLCYWFSTNLMSLGQAGLLKIPAVRTYFNIPIIIKRDPNSMPNANKPREENFIKAAKKAFKSYQATQQVIDRQRYDEVKFTKAGTGPIIKTFKFDPTKSPVKKRTVINVQGKVKSSSS